MKYYICGNRLREFNVSEILGLIRIVLFIVVDDLNG